MCVCEKAAKLEESPQLTPGVGNHDWGGKEYRDWGLLSCFKYKKAFGSIAKRHKDMAFEELGRWTQNFTTADAVQFITKN